MKQMHRIPGIKKHKNSSRIPVGMAGFSFSHMGYDGDRRDTLVRTLYLYYNA